MPDGRVQKIPLFARQHAVAKTIERISDEYPDLYQASRQPGEIPDTEKEQLRKMVTDIFPRKWLSILSSKLIFLSCCDDALTRSTAHPVYKFLAYKKYCLQPENIAWIMHDLLVMRQEICPCEIVIRPQRNAISKKTS